MSSPKRFKDGVGNVAIGTTMGQLLAPDPSKMHVFFDDFNFFDETDGVVWDIAAASGSVALADGDGGTILFTTNAADNALAQIATMNEIFTIESGKKLWFKTKITALFGATQQDVLVGLHVDDQTPIAGAPSDGVYFRKDDGDTNWDFQIIKSSASVAAEAGIATATTGAITLGFYFDGVNKFQYFVNDELKGTVTTTGFPTTELGVAATVQAGNSSAATMTIDYLLAAKER
jgi:hypothetical protein